MKHVSTLVFILLFAVPTVQAQECPNAGTLPASLQASFSSNKQHSNVDTILAIATSTLSIEQQIACIAGRDLLTTEHINADGPFTSSIEELWLGNAWHPNSKSENEYDDDDRLLSSILLRWNPGSQAFVDETARFYTYDASTNTSETLTQTWTGSAFENQYRDVFEKDVFGNRIRVERFDWENGAWKTRFLSTSTVVDGRISETTIQSTHAQGVLANALLQSFEYDGEGRVIVQLEEEWNATSQSWVPETRELISYVGSNAVTIYQEYDGDWVDHTETTESYDAAGLMTAHTSVSLTESEIGFRLLFEYDGTGNLTEMMSQDKNETGEWRNQMRNAFTLDPDGDPLVLLIQMYDQDGATWMDFSRISYDYQLNEKTTSIEQEMLPGLASFNMYPYPAIDRVNVELQLTQASALQVEVFDILGRRIQQLTEGMAPAGVQRLSWIPQNEPAGLYFIRLTIDGAVDTRPLVLVK